MIILVVIGPAGHEDNKPNVEPVRQVLNPSVGKASIQRVLGLVSRTSPSNFSGPELYFKIKIYRTLTSFLARISAS